MLEAFVSYSSRCRAWVRSFHRDLESELGSGTVFLDEVDLGPGRSWLGGLQDGLGRASRVILVASPEAFASPWVQSELDAFLGGHPRWKQEGLVQIALVVDTPLPPFLASAQVVDFRDRDDASYADGLRRLLGALRGGADPRAFPPLAREVRAPAPPEPGLPVDLRNEIVRVLAPLLTPRSARTALAAALSLPPSALEGLGSPACAASAALVLSSVGSNPAEAARRVIMHTLDQGLSGADHDAEEDLRSLDGRLPTPAATTGGAPDATSVARAGPAPVELVHPTGTVPVGSRLYVRREADDLAEREAARAPGMVHILGPRQMGKSSLLARLAAHARLAAGGLLVIQVNFQDDLDLAALSDLRALLVQLSAAMLAASGRDPEHAVEIARTTLAPKAACKRLVHDAILASHPEGVLLAVDETDRIVRPGGCAQDFFEMLRGWHEMGKWDAVWSRLRVALCFCTEAHMAPEGAHGSPLDNVGVKCVLRDFREEEVVRLAAQHGLDPARAPVGPLTEWFGGHPYLVRRTLYALAVEGCDLGRVRAEALRCAGPLGDHLERHLRRLQRQPDLLAAMRDVLARSRCEDATRLRALEGAGLVRREPTGLVAPRCGLYRDFLAARLS
jgi:hypothetical protein